MAEAVVGLLIGKLGGALGKEAATFGASLLCKEASALRGLFGEIRGAKEELESMQAYLQDAERFKDADKTTGIFVTKIRGFAFEIEDVVDEFTYKLQVEKHGGFAAKMKKRLKHIKTWRRLALKLQEIKQRLKDAKQMKRDYAEMNRSEAGGGAPHATPTNQALRFTRDEDLVGIDENMEKLTQWLTGDLEQRSKITTVWGMPGVGKTTLVAHVYDTVKVDFDAAAWVTVSKSYCIEDLLKKIAAEFGIAVAANMEMRSLAKTILDYLQGKKYILVLDDVWADSVWSEIRNVFPTNCVGRFVITSRNHEVSKLATREYAIHLKPLEEHHSWVLFCKGAFWNDDDKECPSELYSLAQKFIGKCQGLPIAIACIGHLLSCKPRTCTEWEDVYSRLESQMMKDVIPDVDMILKVSLEDLPYDLKNCFLHCALFPEDYEITRRRIMRHWIAAGFIREKKNKTLEEVAEEYLTELVNRSLLQVVERNAFGRLKSCRMHDVIRLLALNKAEEECFGKVHDGSEAFAIQGTRRISIQSENLEWMSRSGATHLRALHVFQRYINIDLLKPILTSSNLLSTLDLQGARITMVPSEVCNLFNLRYLGLRDTSIESLPEAIGRLENLEVLDAYDTKLSYLPNSVVKLLKLRYLYVLQINWQDRFLSRAGVKVPNGIRHLTGLRALQSVKASSKILREVGDLTELRTFSVLNVKSEHSADLRNAITKMSHLAHVEIRAEGENEVLRLEGLCLPKTVCWVELQGRLEKTPMLWSHLNNLTRLQLQLSLSHMDEESFSSLLVLHGLCYLELYKAFVGKKLHFCSRSFPKLRDLIIVGSDKLDQVEIEDGAMASLASLGFRHCPELKFLPDGIEHLRALEELYLRDTAEELVERLRQKGEPNEDLVKISHIRKVTVELTKKGIWERIR